MNKIFTILTFSLFLAIQVPVTGENIAAMEVYSLSVQLSSHTNNLGASIYFTTYDGLSSQPRNENGIVSEEFSPSETDPSLYQVDYMAYSGNSLVEYGTISWEMPDWDNDGNGVVDWIQRDKAVDFQVSGTIDVQWPTSARMQTSIVGIFSRSAGSYIGGLVYAYNVNTNDGPVTIGAETTWLVSNFSGTFTYDESGNADIEVFDNRNGAVSGFSGGGNYSFTSEDKVSLNGVQVTDSVYEYSLYTSELTRSGDHYCGIVRFVDGEQSTSWVDYEQWFIIIDDENDSDRDGIPDLTDDTENPTSGGAFTLSGWNYHSWPWVYNPLEQSWVYFSAASGRILLWRQKDENWYTFDSDEAKWVLFE